MCLLGLKRTTGGRVGVMPGGIIRFALAERRETGLGVNGMGDERFERRLEARNGPKEREIQFVWLTS